MVTFGRVIPEPLNHTRMLLHSLRASTIAIICSVLASTSAMAQGDNCAAAVPVAPGTYTADGPATGSGAANICGAGAYNADWYSYTPGGNGTWTVGSCLGGTDTRLSVYSGTCAGLACIGTSDDFCQMTTGGANFASEVSGLPAVAGQTYYIEWDDYWTPAGYDWYINFFCAGAPQSTYDVVPDCPNGTYSISVTVTGLGTATDVNITNTGGAPTINGVGLGTYTVGPFALGSNVAYSILNNQDPGCDSFSPTITNFPCPFQSCGPDNYTYCYADNENTFFVYQSTTTYPVAIVFNAGIMQTFGDLITIYDGDDDQSPILYQGFGDAFGDLTGIIRVSTNPQNVLTLQITSNAFGSCATYALTPMDYTIACLDCLNPAGTFTVVADCPHREFSIQVDLTGTGNATDADIVNDFNTDTIQNVGAGVYTVGPFDNGTPVVVTILNGLNNLCRLNSLPLVQTDDDCVFNTCSQTDTYCYTDNDEAWFVYKAAVPVPLTIQFLQGEMLNSDKVVVYNGFDDLSALIFNGNNGGDMTGVTLNTTNIDNALAVRVLSDAVGSCVGGQVDDDLIWFVSCGAVSVNEEPTAEDFLLYPNPTDGVLNIGLSHQWSGNVQVTVMDLAGRVVLSEQMSVSGGATNTIDLTGLSNGNYAVQLTTERWTKTKQIEVLR